MNAAKLFNIILNIGGIFVSVIGIICIAKIAFVRPWQVSQLGTEVAGLGKVEELPPVSGKMVDPKAAKEARIADLKGAIAELKREDDIKLSNSEINSLSPRPFSVPQSNPAKSTSATKTKSLKEETEALQIEEKLLSKAQKRIESPTPTKTLKVGFNQIDPKLGDAFARGYLKHLGFNNSTSQSNGSVTKVFSEDLFGETQLSVALEWDATEKTSGAKRHKFGTQSVSVVVHPNNPIEHLTIRQLAGIISGRVAQWKTVGGEASAIDLVAVNEPGNEIVKLLKDKVLHDEADSIRVASFDFLKIDDALDNTSAGRGVLAFIPSELVDHQRVKTIAISASAQTRRVLPNQITINSLDYPLANHLYLELPDSMSKFTKGLIEFIDSEQGQKIGNDLGYTMLNTKLNQQKLEQYQRHIQSLLNDKRILPAYHTIIEDADRLHTQTNLSFNYGEMELTKESKQDLTSLADWLISEQTSSQVVLLGFADSVGRYADNKELSLKRAQVAATYLKGRGFENTRSIGFGEEMPIGDNSLDEGKARNRRVEIWLVRELPNLVNQ